jgi:hypothetical protein
MKQTPELDRYQHNMRPGCITLKGMLGTDTRKLTDILTDDNAEVLRLGTTHGAIATRMQQLRDAGSDGLGEPITVQDHYEVRVDSVRGKLPCPFEDAVVQKTFIQVTNKAINQTITYTDLHIHMIDAHGFYEGHGSGFRLPPADLVRILEVPVESP